MTTEFSAPVAADAATSSQVPVKLFAEAPPRCTLGAEATPVVAMHPTALLHADKVGAIIPAIEVFAAHKNIAVAAHEYELLARHALEHVSRNAMRRILAGDVEAIAKIQVAINHALDVLGAANLMAALIAAEGREVPDLATLLRMGEASMKAQFANDKAPTMRIWPDVEVIANEHRLRVSQAVDRQPMLTMPNGAAVQCTVCKPTQRWAAIIRTATPGWEGPLHE